MVGYPLCEFVANHFWIKMQQKRNFKVRIKKNRSGGEKKLARNNNEEKKHIPRRLASFIVGGRFTNWF